MTIRYSTDYDPGLLPRIVGELVQSFNSTSGSASVVAFAGGGQDDATELDYGSSQVITVATKNDSVKLPNALPGAFASVQNDGANLVAIYPSSGEKFYGNGVDDAASANPGDRKSFVCVNSGVWLYASAGETTVDIDTNQTMYGNKLFAGTLTVAAQLKASNVTRTLISNAATLDDEANLTIVTTEALTTAAAANQAFVLTAANVAAGDVAFVQDLGGTNTRQNFRYKAVCSTNTVTVTVYNTEPTNAINGTLKFAVLIVRANT